MGQLTNQPNIVLTAINLLPIKKHLLQTFLPKFFSWL